MPKTLTSVLKDALDRDAVASTVSSYERVYSGNVPESPGQRTTDYESLTNQYYDLVTDLYEWGWGESFHFAPRAPNESFSASLARHEHYLATGSVCVRACEWWT